MEEELDNVRVAVRKRGSIPSVYLSTAKDKKKTTGIKKPPKNID